MSNLVERWKKQLACYRAGFRSSINEQIIIDTIEALKPVEDAEIAIARHYLETKVTYIFDVDNEVVGKRTDQKAQRTLNLIERLAREKAELQAKVYTLEEQLQQLAYTEEELIEASIEIERLVNAHDKERGRSRKYQQRIEELEKQLKNALHLLFKSEGE